MTERILKEASLEPRIKFSRIESVRHIITESDASSEYCEKWGFDVEENFMNVDAQVINAPQVMYGSRVAGASNGAWNLRGLQLTHVPHEVSQWAVVVFGRNDSGVSDFVRTLVKTAGAAGLEFSQERPPIIMADPDGDMRQILTRAHMQAIDATPFPMKVTFIVCILPDTGAHLYRRIKSAAELDLGFMTQCAVMNNIGKGASYCANLSLKINMKLGGFNQRIAWNAETEFMDDAAKPTMIIGIGITHAQNRPSVVAVTGSVDRYQTTYVTALGLVRPKENRGPREHVDASVLIPAFKTVLRLYFERNGRTPRRVIIYRDGVSDGQLQNALNNEEYMIDSANEELFTEMNMPCEAITVTYITVQKNHSIRFNHNGGNVAPGTTVSSTPINNPIFYDFYMVSHKGRLGTSHPRHYYVLYNENSFSANQIQSLTHHLCFNHGRATSAVSAVPSIFYADLIASRAALYIENDNFSRESSNDELAKDDTMWGRYLTAFSPVREKMNELMFWV